MRICILLAVLLSVSSPAQAARVTPIWSSVESEVIPVDTEYSRTAHVLLEDGSAFMVASEIRRGGLAGTLRLDTGGAVTRGQFGHQVAGGRARHPRRSRAAGDDRAEYPVRWWC